MNVILNVMYFHVHQAGLSTLVPKVSTIGSLSETRNTEAATLCLGKYYI